MTIEYIKNVAVYTTSTSNFAYNASTMTGNPPDEIVVRQISYVGDSVNVFVDGEIFMLHCDLINGYIGTMVMLNNQSVTNSNITLKLKQPFPANINFRVDYCNSNGQIVTNDNTGFIALNLDFIKYK